MRDNETWEEGTENGRKTEKEEKEEKNNFDKFWKILNKKFVVTPLSN